MVFRSEHFTKTTKAGTFIQCLKCFPFDLQNDLTHTHTHTHTHCAGILYGSLFHYYLAILWKFKFSDPVAWWNSGHNISKYGILAYWIFGSEKIWKSSKSRKVTPMLSLSPLPQNSSENFHVRGVLLIPRGKRHSYLRRERDSKKNLNRTCLVSPTLLHSSHIP